MIIHLICSNPVAAPELLGALRGKNAFLREQKLKKNPSDGARGGGCAPDWGANVPKPPPLGATTAPIIRAHEAFAKSDLT